MEDPKHKSKLAKIVIWCSIVVIVIACIMFPLHSARPDAPDTPGFVKFIGSPITMLVMGVVGLFNGVYLYRFWKRRDKDVA